MHFSDYPVINSRICYKKTGRIKGHIYKAYIFILTRHQILMCGITITPAHHRRRRCQKHQYYRYRPKSSNPDRFPHSFSLPARERFSAPASLACLARSPFTRRGLTGMFVIYTLFRSLNIFASRVFLSGALTVAVPSNPGHSVWPVLPGPPRHPAERFANKIYQSGATTEAPCESTRGPRPR